MLYAVVEMKSSRLSPNIKSTSTGEFGGTDAKNQVDDIKSRDITTDFLYLLPVERPRLP
jgi:hypothetical protein